MLVLEGNADYLRFGKDGRILSRECLGSYGSGRSFFQTTDKNIYHTIIIRSEWLVFVEVAKGPFVKEDTRFPSWSPPETEPNLGLKYLEGQIENLVNNKG